MKKIILTGLISSILSVILTSCVPAKKLDECNAKVVNCETELSNVKKSAQEAEIKLKELQEKFDKVYKEEVALMRDTSLLGTGFRHLTVQYDKLNSTNNELQKQITELLRLAQQSAQKLTTDLQLSQDQLMKKQEELKLLESMLNKQKTDLETLSNELKNRESRVQELESLLKKKDEDAENLKKKLSEALFNFENKGLTITQKNGKVYVSMDESLLFASGKTTVEPKGVDALKNLAKVLEQNIEINVMVEGHTDNQPMKGTGDIKDNWDLSVMRATSVTKIILSGTAIDAKRITAAGRGEFFPIDPANTPEARKKNRRTEIILTPKLDELLKVLDRN
jgi:chemotaxis protein MotB